MTTPLLRIRGLTAAYGRVNALKGVDIDVNEGEIVTLIGANGAGKSTLMMTICGTPRAKNGTITFAGTDITQQCPVPGRFRPRSGPAPGRLWPVR